MRRTSRTWICNGKQGPPSSKDPQKPFARRIKKAMCKKWQPYSLRSPSFLRKEVPRRGGGWLPQRMEKECEMYLSRFVIPSAAEGSFSFPLSVFLRKAACMKHRTPKSHGVRCFPFPASLTAFPDRERKRFLAFARNDDAGKRLCYRKGGILPPSSGRRCPEGAEVGFRCGIEKQCEMCHPVSSSRAQPRDLFRFPVSVFLHKAVCMKHRTPKSHEACFPFPALLTAFA